MSALISKGKQLVNKTLVISCGLLVGVLVGGAAQGEQLPESAIRPPASMQAVAASNKRFSQAQVVRERRQAGARSEDDFQVALDLVFRRMLTSYKNQESAPLQIQILNENVPSVKKFFDAIAYADPEDPHTVMSLSFDPHARFNGEKTAMCLLRYNSHNRMRLLSGYEQSGIFTKRDTLYYLAAHEFGHCMVFHQALVGAPRAFNAKEHELLADKIAMAFFAVNGQMDVAQKVVDFNRKLVSKPLHSHPDELEGFLQRLKVYLANPDNQREIAGMLDVFYLGTEL